MTTASIGAVALLVAATFVARLLAAWWLDAGVDEAYAMAVARPFSASYFDHPPLVFWLAGSMEWITGVRHAGVARLPFVALFAVTQGATWALTRTLFGARAAWWTLVALSVCGVLGYTDASWVLPDGPLLAGLSVSAWAVARVLFAPDGSAMLRWWLLAGAGAGVAGLAKYHAIFLPIGVLAFLVLTRRWSVLRGAGPWLATLIAMVCVLPVFTWNAAHDWASFRFQLGRAGTTRGWRIDPFVQAVMGQIAYVLPWVWGPVAWAAWRSRRVLRTEARVLFLWCLAAGPIVLFTAVTLGGARGLPHWQAPGYLFLLPLLGAALAEREAAGARWPRRWALGSATIMAVLVALIVTHARTGWVRVLQPAWFTRGDPAHELRGWQTLRDTLDARGMLTAGTAFVATPHWIEGAKAGAALGDEVPVIVLARDARHFAYVAPPASFTGLDGVFVHRRGDFAVDSLLAERFTSVESLAPVSLGRGAGNDAVLDVWRVRGLRTDAP